MTRDEAAQEIGARQCLACLLARCRARLDAGDIDAVREALERLRSIEGKLRKRTREEERQEREEERQEREEERRRAVPKQFPSSMGWGR
jgi:hypothetical protein